jgi:hypothetical protein
VLANLINDNTLPIIEQNIAYLSPSIEVLGFFVSYFTLIIRFQRTGAQRTDVMGLAGNELHE